MDIQKVFVKWLDNDPMTSGFSPEEKQELIAGIEITNPASGDTHVICRVSDSSGLPAPKVYRKFFAAMYPALDASFGSELSVWMEKREDIIWHGQLETPPAEPEPVQRVQQLQPGPQFSQTPVPAVVPATAQNTQPVPPAPAPEIPQIQTTNFTAMQTPDQMFRHIQQTLSSLNPEHHEMLMQARINQESQLRPEGSNIYQPETPANTGPLVTTSPFQDQQDAVNMVNIFTQEDGCSFPKKVQRGYDMLRNAHKAISGLVPAENISEVNALLQKFSATANTATSDQVLMDAFHETARLIKNYTNGKQ